MSGPNTSGRRTAVPAQPLPDVPLPTVELMNLALSFPLTDRITNHIALMITLRPHGADMQAGGRISVKIESSIGRYCYLLIMCLKCVLSFIKPFDVRF